MKNVFPVFEGRQIPSEKKKNMVELLSDTGLIKVLNKLPVNDSVIEQVTCRPIVCLIWLLDWLINLIDQSSYLLYCLITNILTDVTEWLSDWQMTAWLADTTDFHALTSYKTALLTWRIKLTNKLTALLTKKLTDAQTDRQTDRLTELIFLCAVRLMYW